MLFNGFRKSLQRLSQFKLPTRGCNLPLPIYGCRLKIFNYLFWSYHVGNITIANCKCKLVKHCTLIYCLQRWKREIEASTCFYYSTPTFFTLIYFFNTFRTFRCIVGNFYELPSFFHSILFHISFLMRYTETCSFFIYKPYCPYPG